MSRRVMEQAYNALDRMARQPIPVDVVYICSKAQDAIADELAKEDHPIHVVDLEDTVK